MSDANAGAIPGEEERQRKADEASPGRAGDLPERTLVGVGASAGGFDAVKALLSEMPPNPGLSLVIVMHLSPEHDSNLAELLQPCTRMPVTQVKGSAPIEPDHVYVIPPSANLDSVDTDLRVSELESAAQRRSPIDHFFRTMAETHGPRAIAVVLSGTGSDGTLGARRVKERGGLVIAQDPAEAEFDGMPQSAVASGAVDLTLSVREMASQILRLATTKPRVPVEAEALEQEEDTARTLRRILGQVRARTGHDFSRYKQSTIVRRIRRRMQVSMVETLGEYHELLRARRDEVQKLFEDLLITVTEFFRDPDTFEFLGAEILPALFEGKGADDTVRVWSVGCATGEEAYSLAMLMREQAGSRDPCPQLQLFASDLHEESLASAREGLYPASIASDVSPERLERFFKPESGGYRISRDLREMIVFANHNVLRDPPFSRLDMVVCRNLLIYLQRGVQKDLVGLFHYALRNGGRLALGRAETIDPDDLFVREDKRHALYRRLDVPSPQTNLPIFSPEQRTPPAEDGEQAPAEPDHAGSELSFAQLHWLMIERHGPASVLVGKNRDVVHSSAQASRYMHVPAGELTRNIFSLVREPLAMELRTAVHMAEETGQVARSKRVDMDIEGAERRVVVRVRPADDPRLTGFLLVMFDEFERPGLAGADAEEADSTSAATRRELQSELDLTKKRLQSIIEEYETSQEEMQSSNEELQSSNEELRSTLEELETSKEQLQSMNEELQTLNQENQHRVAELSRLSSDLENLLASTDIATLFLDPALRIVWTTPQVEEVFNVRATDKGRPISDLTHRLTDSDLQRDASEVRDHGHSVEREVQRDDGRWYLARVNPYRSSEGRREGVVIALIDITERKHAEESLKRARDEPERRVRERTTELETQTDRLRRLAREVTAAEHRERKRLASVLHDELQQWLVAAKMQTGRARKTVAEGAPERADTDLADVAGLIDDSIAASRDLTHQLRPPVLYEDGLVPALRWLAGDVEKKHHVHVDVTANPEHIDLDEDMRALLFESVRELLFNVVKHAGVEEARVEIEADGERLGIDVVDEGKGFDVTEVEAHHDEKAGLGLFALRERIQSLGGALELQSSPGAGTRTTLELPLVRRDRARAGAP